MRVKILILAAAALLLVRPMTASAAPILDGGWAYDQVDATATDSEFSPYVYALGDWARFSITDDFVVGDIYSVYDFGALLFTTAFNGPQAALGGDPAGWLSGDYSHGQFLLAPGAHSLTIQGDGAGGLPAGFYARIDSVPEPATLTLLGLGVAGLVARRRKKVV